LSLKTMQNFHVKNVKLCPVFQWLNDRAHRLNRPGCSVDRRPASGTCRRLPVGAGGINFFI
jgi:hypothetical protein